MSDPIAARKGDHHLCLQHVGKDILPACAPTILVGGEPAARVTDQLECTGSPPDIIGIGEPTVLLEGKMAARFGDGTLHGGLIDEGCPTVIIGKMTAADKRMRLMERLRLIDQARQRAASMPNGPEKDRLSNAAERLARNNRSVEDARLVNDVYRTSGAPEGWTRLGPNDLPPELRNAVFHDDSTGFYSDLYRSDIDGSYRLVMRGTEFETWKQWNGNDWLWGNLSQGTGFEGAQYTQAVELSRQVAAVYGNNASIAGHSLGGGLASAGSLASGLPANTFNASGIHDKTYERYGLDPSRTNDLIDAYQVDGDILTWAQEHSPISGLMPDAIGNRYGLNAVNQNPDGSFTARQWPPEPTFDHPDSGWGYLNPFGMARRTKDWAAAEIDQEKKRFGEMIERHSTHEAGIEQQKSQDIATIQGMM
ncbi:PAAR domain-containing protein [Polyangium jinanense]|uniref:PAAR domain-containing protein n=1 Tax=Polyangium jinanense TaxID=2829994 RepID=A0A9X3XID5_9BACT|nr:PAAR domain-containing protein [Polyangium jinanense]MDC3962481.1 PAAR domain-containing protein [Polyangium jinanense]MDC3989238.1 PAAR domain-containing protein [Polyangium jinanense]MDC3989583.1 PAAR domain-containing protein [Polyangium jinanense]